MEAVLDGDSHDTGPSVGPRVASILAVHLVNQVLNEARIIANTAKETGQPWQNLTLIQHMKSGIIIHEENIGEKYFTSAETHADDAKENVDTTANVVATSTPQKNSDETNRRVEAIGQGDEDYDLSQDELSKSTSMFINHLFDMSEVERVIICDDMKINQNNPQPNNLLSQAMANIMESCVNTALDRAFHDETVSNDPELTEKSSRDTESSSYSFLVDALVDTDKDGTEIQNKPETNNATSSESIRTIEINDQTVNEHAEKYNVAFYESTYLTLNRDYDQCSEDNIPVIDDSKAISLQEVELLTAHTSEENLTPYPKRKQKIPEFAATSAVSASATGSRKSSLVHRCRIQGARLLACLRGWWRRKTPRKRKEIRVSGSIRGFCPLSPDARRRGGSLMDQRLRSPSPSRSVVWKFNTVNEAVVNSSRWKGYTFDMKPEECSTEGM